MDRHKTHNAVCPICDTSFYASPKRIERTKGVMYCSRACQTEAANRRPRPTNATCLRCGKPFFAKPGDVRRGFGKYCSKVCSSTATVPRGEHSPMYKGGGENFGYKMVRMIGHPRENAHGLVPVATLVMEQALERHLESNEVVHHINHIRDDNRIENLQLMDRHEHQSMHMRERYHKSDK